VPGAGFGMEDRKEEEGRGDREKRETEWWRMGLLYVTTAPRLEISNH